MSDIIFPDGTTLSVLKYGIQICTSITRPGSPVEGMHIYETDTDKLYYWTGAAWAERTGGGGAGDVVANATRNLNRLTKWTDATNKIIGNSSITDDGINPIIMGNTIVPYSGTYDLGDTSYYWNSLYLGDKLYFGDTTDYLLDGTNAIDVYLNSALVASFGDALVDIRQHIHMNDFAIDFRADNVHTIGYGSGTNSLDIQSYDELRFLLTQNGGVVPMSIMTDGIRIWEALFIRKNQASDTVYIVDDATANMEFHVGAGKVFEFIVG